MDLIRYSKLINRIDNQESVLIGSKKSHTTTITAAACLLLAGCIQSNGQAGQTARPATTAPAQVAMAGPSKPRVAEPVEMARQPAEATSVELALI